MNIIVMRSTLIASIAASTLIASMASHAAPITRTYEGQASGFVNNSLLYPNLISPYPTVNFSFTVTYDPSVSTGLLAAQAVDAYSGTLALPDFGPWLYQYDAGTKLMTIGDHCLQSGSGCSFTLSGTDAIFKLGLGDPDNPVLQSMTLRATGTYPSGSGGDTLGTFSPSTKTMAGSTTSVPAPGTLALLGLGLVGFRVSRRRRA
jgi:hypothetical protein